MLRDLKTILGEWCVGLGIRETWIQILTYETLGKSLHFSSSAKLQ